MTRAVVTVGPDNSVEYAAEIMLERGFAALPVVGDADQRIGIVAEADVLVDRLFVASAKREAEHPRGVRRR